MEESWEVFAQQLRQYFDPFDKNYTAREEIYKLQHCKGALREHISRFSQLLLHLPSMVVEDRVRLFVNSL